MLKFSEFHHNQHTAGENVGKIYSTWNPCIIKLLLPQIFIDPSSYSRGV